MENKTITRDFGSIMILVPHQDDEILMAAGIIKNSLYLGLRLSVVMATNGDYGCPDYSAGRMRLRETLAGLNYLGLSSDCVTFLGYGDTGMPEKDSFLSKLYQEADWDKRYPSSCSEHTYGLEDKADFHTQQYGKPGEYSRKGFESDLRDVLRLCRPDHIFTTSDADTHGDHKGLFLFLMDILADLKQQDDYSPQVYCGIVHSMAGDDNWPLPSDKVDCYTCPQDFDHTCRFLWEDRLSFEVPAAMQTDNRLINEKYQALSLYQTALEPNAVEFLYSFIKKEELFWKISHPFTP